MDALNLVSSAARGRQSRGRLKGPIRSGRFVASATEPVSANSRIADLAQAMADAPEAVRQAYATVQDLLKKGVVGQELTDAQKKLIAARKAAQGGGAMAALFAAIVAVVEMTSSNENTRKFRQREVIKFLANRIKPTLGNPEPTFTVQALYAIGETLKELAKVEKGQDDVWTALRYESGKTARLMSAAIMIANISGFEFSDSNSDYLWEVAELTLGYLPHWLAVAEEKRDDKSLPASARESLVRAARTIQDRIAVLRGQLLPFVVENWKARRAAEEKAEAAAKQSKSTTPKPEVEGVQVTPKEETLEATLMTLQDLEAADDSPLGAFTALKAKLGLTDETEVYLRPVEGALRDGDPVSAAMSLTDVLANFGEMMPAAAREALDDFRKAIAETASA